MKAAAVQLNSQGDAKANRATAERLVCGAAAAGAELVVLPEKWPCMGSVAVLRASAEPLDGPTVGWACALARELGIDLVAGSLLERAAEGDRLFNTSVHAGPGGEVAAVYRKVHMFDVEVDGQAYRESDLESPGDEIVTSTTAAGVELGLSICYDLRFPELYRILAVRGALVMVVPAAFTLATTREHWATLLRARAIENQAFVVAANQIGEHPPKMRSGGRSMIVDPWGVVLAQAPDSEGWILADLDLERQQQIRRSLPALSNRRPEAYRWPTEVGA